MVATAQSILFNNNTARNIANQGGERSSLTVNFSVASKGPAHVAGLIWTSDFWRTPNTSLAVFQSFSGDLELWQATVTTPGRNVSFEYVIFCEDYRDIQNVKKIYNTNNGETFRIQASSF